MKQWWEDRSTRERTLVLGVGGLAVVFSLFQFLLLPLVHYRASARDQYEAALATLQDVESGARLVRGLRTTGDRPEGGVRTVVAATATELGLAITRLQPVGDNQLDVWLDAAASPLLYSWVTRLQDRGILVARAVIQKNDGTTVSAQMTFAEGPGR